MSAFEFFFSLYGLVLGLSVVEIVSGFARLAHDRRGVKIGWLTPMLALLVLLDLVNFWISAYGLRDYELSYGLLVIGLLIAAGYYLAASVIFPRDFEQEPDFDAVFLRHRRLIMSVLIFAGLAAFELLPALTAEGRAARLAAWTDPGQVWWMLLFIGCAVGIMATRGRRLHVILLSILIGVYLIQAVASLV